MSSEEQYAPFFEELHPTAPAPLDGAAPEPGKTPGGLPRSVWRLGGLMLLTIVGLGTALAVRSNSQAIDPNAEMARAPALSNAAADVKTAATPPPATTR